MRRNMFTIVARVILKNRPLLLLLLGIITAFMLYMAGNVKMSYEPASLLPANDSTFIENEQFTKIFGKYGNLVVVGMKTDSFFETKQFNDWTTMVDSINNVHGVEQAFSLSEAFSLKKNKAKRNFEFVQVTKKGAVNKAEVDSIKSVLTSLPFYKGTLYNDKENSYILAVVLDREILQSKKRNKLIDDIIHHTDEFAKKHNTELKYSGLPYIRIKVANKIKNEMFLFVLLAAVITSVLLFLFYRSIRVVAFSLLVVGVAVGWALGWMAILDFKITILTAVIPPLLIVIGIPNCVFLLNKYHQEYKNHGNKIKALQRVIQKIGSATFMTNLTTALGFATFIFTETRILKEFGVIASVNIIGVYFISLLLIPIIFSFFNPPKQRHIKHLNNDIINRLMDKLVNLTVNYRKAIYVGATLLVGVAIYGISLIESTGYMVDDLPKHDPIYTDLLFMEDNFKGVLPLDIAINTEKKRGALNHKTIKTIDNIEKALAKYPELSKPISINSAAKFARQAYYNGKESSYKLPSRTETNFILSYLRRSNTGGQNDYVFGFIDSTASIARIQYNVADIGTKAMLKLEDNIRADVDSVVNGKYKTIVTGASVVNARGNDYLVNSLFTSLFLAVLLISIFMAWMFTSWRMVIISLIPNVIPLLVTAMVMGYFGIPIKPSTVLVFSIAFGISIDDTIHYLAKYRQELKHSNLNIRKSAIYAVKETGVSMFYTSVVLFFGFSIFSASDFGGTKALGILVSLTLFVAMFSNLVLLPSLLLTLDRVIISKSFKEPLLQIYDEEEDIELDDLKIVRVESDKKEENIVEEIITD
jgi:predicted RND superfamily exporter protein